jgi:hypothetical protein
VGWKNYPRVYAGPLSLNFSPPDSLVYDNPKLWYGYDFPQIVDMRSSLIRSQEKTQVSTPTESLQLLALAKSPPDIEVMLKKSPQFTIIFSAIAQPMGPSGMLQSLHIVDNVSPEKSVDRITSDEINAQQAVWMLYQSDIDVYAISKLMSAGLLGIKKKMVPTRWSITTVDNLVGTQLIQQVKSCPVVNDYQVFSNEYLGNHFEILIMPQPWEYEHLEAWVPDTFWTMGLPETRIIGEHETHNGRSDYAIREGGGYYAVRLAVLEHLNQQQRQGAVLVFRETTPDYYLSVGVWECRENVRNARKMGTFSSLNDALQDITSRLQIPLHLWKEKSILLNQSNLDSWM